MLLITLAHKGNLPRPEKTHHTLENSLLEFCKERSPPIVAVLCPAICHLPFMCLNSDLHLIFHAWLTQNLYGYRENAWLKQDLGFEIALVQYRGTRNHAFSF